MKKILFSLLMLCGSMTAAWAEDDGFVEVDTTEKLWNAIQTNDHAKVRLTADFALSDINKDYELYCNGNTFYGTIDGNGHTIKGDPNVAVRARTYMFSNCSGATFKNLTFKGIRVNSQSNPNQAIITAKADNRCVFENITFENVHTFSDCDNVGSVAGWAQECTFTNITVRNSDFTTDDCKSGAVVGFAESCNFTNIKIENCESTAYEGKAGGVVGCLNIGSCNNVEILGCFIKTNFSFGGGVTGDSQTVNYYNCIVDDQSCVCVVGCLFDDAQAGGIVGRNDGGGFYNCINSALIAADHSKAGGIVGACWDAHISDCLNTGMVIAIGMSKVKDSFYNKYKTRSGMTCVTKTYQGKEYVIRKYDEDSSSEQYFGGIAGMFRGTLFNSVNLGSIYCGNKSKTSGIAGAISCGAIGNCLSDFSGTVANGICCYERDPDVSVSVNNCLNMTTHKDISVDDVWGDFKGEHNYSLTTATDAHHTTKTTAAKIKSGEICHLLGKAWEQNIGTDAYPTPTGNKGLYHTRKVRNEYGTACFPFPVKSDDKISYYRLSRKEEDGQDIKLVFKYVETENAGFPVLYRSAEAKDADANNPVEISFNNAGDDFASVPLGNIGGYWELYGTFEQKEFDETTSPSSKNIYYVSGGEIKNAKKTAVAPYRAWIYGENIDTLNGSNASQAKAIKFVIADENGETTALELVGDDLVPVQQGGKAYSVMGTEVGDGYRGLVIRNGKKVIQNR